MKQGHRLREIGTFPRPVVDRLRDEFSVTTAEEFVDLGHRHAELLAAGLRLDEGAFRELYEAALASLAPAERREILQPASSSRTFATGHEPPVDGQTFYEEDRDRE